MKELRELSQQMKELIDESDTSFKQIENIKRDIDECQKQCQRTRNEWTTVRLDVETN